MLAQHLDGERLGVALAQRRYDIGHGAVAALGLLREAQVHQPAAEHVGVTGAAEGLDVADVEIGVVEGGQQSQDAQRFVVQPAEQQGQQIADLGGAGQGTGAGRFQPGEGGGTQQQQGAPGRRLPQVARRGALRARAHGPPQFAGEQVEGGGAADAVQAQGGAVAEQGSVPARDDERGVGRRVHEGAQALRGEVGVVDVDGDAHAGHQPAQFGAGGGVPPGLVAGLEQVLGEVLGFAPGRVEEEHAVAFRGQGAGRVPQQGALADAGRAPQLDRAAVADGGREPGQVGVPAERRVLPPGQQGHPVAAHRAGPAALHEEGDGRAVLGVDDDVVITGDDRAARVARDVDSPLGPSFGPSSGPSSGSPLGLSLGPSSRQSPGPSLVGRSGPARVPVRHDNPRCAGGPGALSRRRPAATLATGGHRAVVKVRFSRTDFERLRGSRHHFCTREFRVPGRRCGAAGRGPRCGRCGSRWRRRPNGAARAAPCARWARPRPPGWPVRAG